MTQPGYPGHHSHHLRRPDDGGIRDHGYARDACTQVTISDPRCAPRLVIYDPKLTLDLPGEMTASSGINALAHCIEALYSVRRHPISTAAAIGGVRYINNALLRCYAIGEDLDARTEMLLGAHLAGFSLASVTVRTHHGLCHVLGGRRIYPMVWRTASSCRMPCALTQILP
jgi:alcohol dehydrogenase class IV